MANHSGKRFLLTTNFYQSVTDTALLAPKNQEPEGEAAVHPEGMTVNNQDKTTTKQLTARKNQANKLHAKLVHTKEDRMHATVKRLH